MSSDRVIFHVDMDAFFASIAQLDDPSLKGKPVLVGGTGPRSVVTAASYEARPFGCRSAMPMAQALRQCPDAIVVKVPGARIREMSAGLFDTLADFSPLVEPLSVDEAFIDMTGTERLMGPPEDAAQQLRKTIYNNLSLTASVGVAPNKFIAKLASDHNKPDGLTIVTEDEVVAWLAALPIGRMWGIGKVSEKKMRERGIRTVGDLTRMPDEWMRQFFGSEAERYRSLALGRDDRPVVPDHQAKSIGHEQTFGQDLTDPDAVRSVLLDHVEQVGWRLRRRAMSAGKVTLKIRFGDFKTITRSNTLEQPTDTTQQLWREARAIFDDWARVQFKPVRLIGFSAGTLTTGAGQLGLYDREQNRRNQRVDATLDAITEKFGKRTVVRGETLGRAKRQQPGEIKRESNRPSG